MLLQLPADLTKTFIDRPGETDEMHDPQATHELEMPYAVDEFADTVNLDEGHADERAEDLDSTAELERR